MPQKVIKYVEYIGDKEEKRYYSNLYSEKVVFKENEDFGGRKVTAVHSGIADELLRFPAVFREIEVSEIVRETDKGGNQASLLEKEDAGVVDSGKGKAKQKK